MGAVSCRRYASLFSTTGLDIENEISYTNMGAWFTEFDVAIDIAIQDARLWRPDARKR